VLQKEIKKTKLEIALVQVLCRLLSAASGSSAIYFHGTLAPRWIIPQKERGKEEN